MAAPNAPSKSAPVIRCLYDKLVPVGELKPHPRNRNAHPDDQIVRLAQILEYQGWRYPVKVSRLSGFITSGHGRLLAAQKNGWAHVPVNFQEYESEAQEYADAVADNSIASWSELDLDGIRADLGELGEGFDLDLLGIKDFDLGEKLESGCDEDDVPDAPAEPRTKRGDLYQLGRHRLLCGDSTCITDVERLMGGEKADMIFTDPPYNQEANGWGIAKERPGFKSLRESDLNDFDPAELFSILSILKPPSLYVFTSKGLLRDYLNWADEHRDNWEVLVMHKANPIPLKNLKYLSDVEWLIFSRLQGAHWDNDQDFEFYRKVRTVSCKESEHGHPTEKQVAFIEPYLRISAPDNGNVLDLFGGSGSTLIACEKTGRSCRAMELEPRYCDVIVTRWEKFTGKKAQLLTEREPAEAADGAA